MIDRLSTQLNIVCCARSLPCPTGRLNSIVLAQALSREYLRERDLNCKESTCCSARGPIGYVHGMAREKRVAEGYVVLG